MLPKATEANGSRQEAVWYTVKGNEKNGEEGICCGELQKTQ